MQEQSYDIPLHDIKPIVEVQEYSLYYFGAIVFVLAVLLVFGIFMLVRSLRKRKVFNLRKAHKELLLSIDVSDAKKAAYSMTFYGATFKNDTPRHEQMYLNLITRLESYKYRKEVGSLDQETLGYYNLYKEMCDV